MLLLIAGAAFLIACMTGYLLLSRRRVDPHGALPPLHGIPAGAHRVPGAGVKLLLVCVMLVLAGATFFAVAAALTQLFGWLFSRL